MPSILRILKPLIRWHLKVSFRLKQPIFSPRCCVISMKAIPLIRVGVVLPVVDFLTQIGSPTDRLLGQINLSPTALDHPENLLPLYQGSTLLENAAELEGLEALGFLVGRQTSLHKLGTLGSILDNSLTLFDLLITLEQVVGLANSGERASLRWEHDSVWWQFHCDQPAQESNLQTYRYDLGLYLNALRRVLGSTWRPTELCLEGPPCRLPITANHGRLCWHHHSLSMSPQCHQNPSSRPQFALQLSGHRR